jgi:hypothetical protein
MLRGAPDTIFFKREKERGRRPRIDRLGHSQRSIELGKYGVVFDKGRSLPMVGWPINFPFQFLVADSWVKS